MNDSEKIWWFQMRSLLRHNVPRFVKHIAKRGGVSEEEWQWMQCEDEDISYPQGVLARADEYLLFPKDEKTFKHGLLVLVKAIAIMSFVSGGVHIFGLHFCSEIDDFVSIEDGCTEA